MNSQRYILRWSVCLLVLFWAADTFGQQRIAGRRRSRPKIIGDTTKVFYNYLSNPTAKFRVDSSLYEFENLVPTWGKDEWYMAIGGLLGTPTYDLVYQSRLRGGFRVGLEQFKRYQLTQDQVKYYQIKDYRPYTDLYYSQINQKNNYVKADFGYRFNDNIYLGLQYNLMAQSAFFNNQKVRNQNVGFTFRVITNNKRYHGYFNFLTNAIKYEENGGIVQDSVVDVKELSLAFLDTRSDDEAINNYNLTAVSYSQFLYNNSVDTLGKETKATNEWSHRLTYQFNRYKFYDTTPNALVYGDAFTNSRGLRMFIRHQLLENEIGFRQAIGKGSLATVPFWIKAYASYSLNILRQEPIDYLVHNFSAGIITENNPQLKLKYRIEGKMTLAERQLDFYVKGRLGYDMGKFGYLQGRVLFQRYQPTLVDRLLYVSWDQVWDNDATFRQVQELNFGGSYEMKRWGFKAEVINHTLTNWVYYDSMRVNQAPSSINILQLKVQQNFKFWKIHLDNQVIWQPTLVGREYVRVPELLFKHNLYIQSYVFKKAMLAKIGVSFYYNTAYYVDGYLPLTGTFYNQNSRNISMMPRVDAYFSFRIWQFRCFIRGENFLYFLNNVNYDTAYRYPIHNVVVRLGISWRLFD